MMHVSRKRLGGAIAGLGLVGVATLVLLPVERLAPGPLPMSAGFLRLLSVINPALLVVGAAWVGTLLAHRIGLDAPTVRLMLAGYSPVPVLRRQAERAVWPGLAAGVMLAGYGAVSGSYFASFDADAVLRLQALAPPFVTRVLYGGIAEEIIARWGVMTLVSWLAWCLIGRSPRPPDGVYWIGIVTAALVFGLTHLPLLYGVTGDPPLWLPMLAVGVNMIAGTAFGWLYWRAGLDAAILAHALAHISATVFGAMLPLPT